MAQYPSEGARSRLHNELQIKAVRINLACGMPTQRDALGLSDGFTKYVYLPSIAQMP